MVDWRKAALITLVILPGAAAMVVGGSYLFRDWGALATAYLRLETAINTGADLRALQAASARDMIYRVNCLADGLGVMLGALLFGLGVHGLCTLHSHPERKTRREENAKEGME